MPSATDCRAYPFPLGTDPIDVAGDLSKLANKIDDDVCLLFPRSLQAGTAAGRPGAPIEGALYYETDTKRYWRWDGTAWRWWAGNRPRFRIVGGGSGQSLATGTAVAATFAGGAEVYDSDTMVNFPTNAIFVCPTGFPGRWRFDYGSRYLSNSQNIRNSWLEVNTAPVTRYAQTTVNAVNGGDTILSGSTDIVLTAGQLVNVVMFHAATGSLVANSNVSDYFQGSYVGPE